YKHQKKQPHNRKKEKESNQTRRRKGDGEGENESRDLCSVPFPAEDDVGPLQRTAFQDPPQGFRQLARRISPVRPSHRSLLGMSITTKRRRRWIIDTKLVNVVESKLYQHCFFGK
ncbi:hypothetical protein LINGRAHAP2_LOCUS33770, partial [Linum grandiflorum]